MKTVAVTACPRARSNNGTVSLTSTLLNTCVFSIVIIDLFRFVNYPGLEMPLVRKAAYGGVIDS